MSAETFRTRKAGEAPGAGLREMLPGGPPPGLRDRLQLGFGSAYPAHGVAGRGGSSTDPTLPAPTP
jgi:hypothetical protein